MHFPDPGRLQGEIINQEMNLRRRRRDGPPGPGGPGPGHPDPLTRLIILLVKLVVLVPFRVVRWLLRLPLRGVRRLRKRPEAEQPRW